MKILLVEDQLTTSLAMQARLKKMGYAVDAAENGQEAWDRLQQDYYPIVLTDWLMPVMDGLELCRTIRKQDLPRYTYTILGTSKSSQEDLIQGLEAGADDFIAKPYNPEELRIKLRNAERIIGYEQKLADRTKELEETLGLLQRDLEQAAIVQQSLLPTEAGSWLGIAFDWVFLPSSGVGGDSLNVHQIDQTHVAFYLLDVVGHGIPAAMEAMSISKFLSPDYLYAQLSSATKVVAELNQRYQSTLAVMQHFTLAFGILNTQTHQLRMVHAGHPPTLLIKQQGTTQKLEQGGIPIGIVPEAKYQESLVNVEAGDRLFLYSDGIIECTNPAEEGFGLNRFQRLLEDNKDRPLQDVLQTIQATLCEWAQRETFEDDVTVLGIEIGT